MNDRSTLRSGTLSFAEVLATSVALIGLTMTPVLVAPYTFASAGNGSWLAYVFGGVMLLLVAFNLNQFARRSSSAGSMYGYVVANLGPKAGAMAGWTLIWAYVFVGASQFGAMILFVQNMLSLAGAHSAGAFAVGAIVFVLLAALLYALAYCDIQISTVVMLVLEMLSVLIISILVIVILVNHGTHVDMDQVRLKGVQASGIGLGIATAIFSFVGFESATAFGEEARNPLRTIPRAVTGSVVIAALFFIVCLYAETVGLHGSGTTLDKLTAPLWTLADRYHVAFLKIPIGIGAMFSSFSVALACVTTCARILLPMSRKGLLPAPLAKVQPRFATPYVAVAVALGAMMLVALCMYAAHVDPVNVFNYCGTLSAFAFIVIYAMIAVAAPLYLGRIGQRRRFDIVVAVAAILCLLVAAVTLVFPVPPPPTNYFAYIFIAYLLVGFGVLRASKAAAQA